MNHKILADILRRMVSIDTKLDALIAHGLPDQKLAQLTAQLKASQEALQKSLDAVPPE